ncbi:MAG: SDR family oxidoreductase [Ferruginibacter sp.]
MQIIIFGATGLVGKELVKQALFNGHQVKAFGRNIFTADLPSDDKLELVQGALFDEGQVYKAIKGCDAVLAAVGGDTTGADLSRSLGMKNIVSCMQKAGVKRIVTVGGIGILDADEETLLMDSPEFPAKLFPVSKEYLKAYEYLKASDLDWTIVCAPDITDSEATGHFITAGDHLPVPDSNRIIAGDLALFMLNELEKKEFTKHRVGISN